nr:hyaluronidase-5-like [Paramormyrops kingsleyae]
MPTPVCKQNNIPLDTQGNAVVTTPEAVPDQFLFLFYTNRLGLYPFVDEATNKEINGGIPQKGNLTASLDIAQWDVAHYMPSETSLAESKLAEDLVHTLGENAAVGASGSVLWGGSADFHDKASCEALSSYLTSTLNPYIANVTAASRLCSESLCQGNGRCIRKDYNSDVYLHLNPASFSVRKSNGKYVAVGIPTLSDLTYFSDHFTCQCYAGLSCSPRIASELPIEPVAIPV